MARVFARVESTTLFTFEHEKDSVEGTLAKKGNVTFRATANKPETVVGKYELTDDDGVTRMILGTTQLDQMLGGVDDGTYVRVTYIGNVRTKSGMSLRQFDVETSD